MATRGLLTSGADWASTVNKWVHWVLLPRWAASYTISSSAWGHLNLNTHCPNVNLQMCRMQHYEDVFYFEVSSLTWLCPLCSSNIWGLVGVLKVLREDVHPPYVWLCVSKVWPLFLSCEVTHRMGWGKCCLQKFIWSLLITVQMILYV